MAVDHSAPPRPAMSTRLGRLLALALAFAVAGVAAERARADDSPRFTILDEDDDGVVAEIEYLRNKTKIFFRVVKDHIDQDPRLGPDEINVTPQAFADADLDGDGKLSGAEFVQAPFVQFEAIDTNGDKKI